MPREAAQPGSVSRENAEHYRWGDDCDGWHLVKSDDLSVIEELIPSGYILSGEAMMEVEGRTTLLRAGAGIRVLPGARHQISNPSSSTVRFLVISQPPSHGDRFTE